MVVSSPNKKPCTANAVQGFSNCRFLYAERKLATGRAVLLDCLQAKSISHEFGSGPCPIDTSRLRPRPDHTCFTRLSISRMYDSLAPGPAGFTKNLVYFLCKVCYTVISVRRDGQTRAEKKRNTRAFCGQRDHLPDDSGSKGMALAAWYLCAFYTGALI